MVFSWLWALPWNALPVVCVSDQQHGTDGEERLSVEGIGLAIEFSDRHTPRKARCVDGSSGNWDWACLDKIKHEAKQEPCQGIKMENMGQSWILKA